MTTGKRMGVLLLGAALLCMFAGGAFADYPEKNITWLVPYSPGGGFDLHSRAIVPGLKRALGANILIRNVPGAGGNIGWNLLWKAKPDGYTLAIVNIPGAIVSELYGHPKPQYKLKELTWIGQISAEPYMFAAGADTPFHSLADLRKAKEVLVTGTGVGGTAWVADSLTAGVMGFNERFILGYPSAPAATLAITRGEGQARSVGMDSPGQMAFVKDGSMRPLWVYLEKRSPDYPNVPTVGELGFPKLRVLAAHRVVAGPPGMPADVTAKLRKAFLAATKDPQVIKSFQRMDAEMDPIVGKKWDEDLNTLYDLIEEHASIFKEAIK
jgi:tripartite-type tricarboxylate transporter receptor subunit TctC